MQVNQGKFEAIYTSRAYARVSGQPEAAVPAAPEPPNDGFVGHLKRWLGFRPTPAVLQAQSKLTMHAAFQALGTPTALALAQDVGLQLEDGKNEAGLAYRDSHTLSREPQALAKGERVWERIVAASGTSVGQLTLLDGAAGEGRFVDRSIFADAGEFATLSEDVALFRVAHEVGHVEHGDGARKHGVKALADALGPYHSASISEARTEANRQMEFAADQRAAQIAARAGCDPLPILRDLLTLGSTSAHPPGVERARRVRETMAEHGIAVSQESWDSLVLQTAVEREENQRRNDEQMSYLQTMENLV